MTSINIHGHFQRSVQWHAQKEAISGSSFSLTYDELNRLSNQVARFLRHKGLKKGDRVGLLLDKHPVTYAAIVACWKLGLIYFCMDPKNPQSRQDFILERCVPGFVFSPENFKNENLAPFTDDDVETEHVLGSDPAYIMYTSGSTGFPKGALISNANVLSFVAWAQKQFDLQPTDRFTHLNPLHFDNSVFDIYGSLLTGGTLLAYDSFLLSSPFALAEALKESRPTVYFSVPSVLIYLLTLRAIQPSTLANVKNLIFGGEGFPKRYLKELMDIVGEHCRFHNAYGPTECTCMCSSYEVRYKDVSDQDGLPPLGSIAEQFETIVVNEQGQPAVPNEVGELYLSGAGTGLGYFNQPIETRTSFVSHPLNPHAKGVYYKTGDLVRLNSRDGHLYFAGRNDSQIKHMGYRIELQEIQMALLRLPQVKEAVVVYDASEKPGWIVAFVVSSEDDTLVIKKDLQAHLPRYMIPERIWNLPSLPKNANGKADVQRLRELHP